MALMVVFGAGASFDSFAEVPPTSGFDNVNPVVHGALDIEWRLPLAQGLFSRQYGGIAVRYPHCQRLFPLLRRSTAIEQTLEEIVASTGDDPSVLRELMAMRYYLRDVIQISEIRWKRFTSGITNYSELLGVLRGWQLRRKGVIGLTTFNYDQLLDDAWAGVLHRATFPLEAHIEDPNWKLLKVHGSVNWLRRVENVEEVTPPNRRDLTPEETEHLRYIEALSSVHQLAWSQTYATTQELQTACNERANNAIWVPAIAMPTQRKTSFECPQAHLLALRKLIPQVTHILAIGWRGAEQHFLSLWQGPNKPVNLQRIQIVTGSEPDAQEVTRNFSGAGLTCSDVRIASSGFSAFLQSGRLKDFLDPDL